MTKVCGRCKEVKPVEAFNKNARTKSGFHSWCRVCSRAYKASRDRGEKLKARFNITLDQYNEMHEAQNHQCASCGRHQNEFEKWFDIDHNHKCCPARGRSCGKCIRGLLCRDCNLSEGLLGTADRALALAAYMLRNEDELAQPVLQALPSQKEAQG